MQFLWEEHWWGGINRVKQHLAHARGNVELCPSVPNDLRAEMLNSIEAYRAKKAKNKKIQKDIGKSSRPNESDSDYNSEETPEDQIPSFQGSTTIPAKGKRPRTGLDSFLYPALPPMLNPPLMLNGRRWRKRLLGNALLDGGMMQTYFSMQLILHIINLW